jgi:hypothetical protein
VPDPPPPVPRLTSVFQSVLNALLPDFGCANKNRPNGNVGLLQARIVKATQEGRWKRPVVLPRSLEGAAVEA